MPNQPMRRSPPYYYVRREPPRHSPLTYGLGALIVLGIVAIGISSLPDIVRYIKISNM